MTEREMIMRVMERLGQSVWQSTTDPNYIELDILAHDCVSIQFDDNGNIVDMY